MSAGGGRRRAGLVGTGLIGGSVGLALRRAGWHVTATDADAGSLEAALDLGVADRAGIDQGAEITFVAVPVGVAPEVARVALSDGGVVTDVGSVKAPVVRAVDSPRFVGGHPMAGSEATGLDGAREDLFDGAVWVLTPVAATESAAHALVHGVVRSLGADVVSLDPVDHDRLVAMVSHVPHLTAAALMGLAAERARADAAVLRLAAGGFRDMTRIAAGDPGIWLDICDDNRDAILAVLDDLLESLRDVRSLVASGDRTGLLERLRDSQRARRSLPVGAGVPDRLAEVRVAIPDRPGELSAVTTLATVLDVNVLDVEVAHEAGASRGLLILVVAADRADEFADALRSSGRSASVHPL
ncbi:MAG: prephenate dehydrogenase/arogenate dehydrogenase family protein [Microthrixaceae bacterium]